MHIYPLFWVGTPPPIIKKYLDPQKLDERQQHQKHQQHQKYQQQQQHQQHQQHQQYQGNYYIMLLLILLPRTYPHNASPSVVLFNVSVLLDGK